MLDTVLKGATKVKKTDQQAPKKRAGDRLHMTRPPPLWVPPGAPGTSGFTLPTEPGHVGKQEASENVALT